MECAVKGEGAFAGFRKRTGLVVPFRREKIETAIQAACQAVERESGYRAPEDLPGKVTKRVIDQLLRTDSVYYVHENEEGKRIPRIEDVQDLVEIALAEAGETTIVTSYKRYRKQREVARSSIRVRGEASEEGWTSPTPACCWWNPPLRTSRAPGTTGGS